MWLLYFLKVEKDKKPKDDVFLNKDGFIELAYHGPHTESDVLEVSERMVVLGDKHYPKDKKITYILNTTDLGKTDSKARKAAVESIPKLRIKKLGVFGGDVVTRAVVNFIVTAIGRNDLIRYFRSREEAEKWLKE